MGAYTSLLCRICKGSGNLVSFTPLTFWPCHYCGGAGVSVQFGPQTDRERR